MSRCSAGNSPTNGTTDARPGCADTAQPANPTRDDGRVQSDGRSLITIEVLPRHRPSGFAHFLRLVLTLGRYEYWLMSRPDYEARVVAKNRAGNSFLLFRVASDEEAEEKAARLRAELADAPSLEGWCDRYVVPSGFVEGTWQPKR